MNKSVVTNSLALILALVGFFSGQAIILSVGLFALSGAFTNWLAVHMLFEKVPLLYGSGVIPANFEQFKSAIKVMMMEQFFTKENIDNFMSEKGGKAHQFKLSPIIEKVDLAPAFDTLVDVVEKSSFGSMLAMFGGTEALMPLKDPFIEKMKGSMIDITESQAFSELLREQLEQPSVIADMQDKVSEIIDIRLAELTPKMVKEIIQTMIKKHLGWLVVWGGVFGGLFGLAAALI
ncbi:MULTISPECIES: hypothetical protein [unclassified Pseudoalteromonas]|uniref:hypothetical protein n=1 Tax=unclassified Pseudoalteromonas TaxID=194690 RepID=UPI0005A71091|nr:MULTISPECIES: hypothetical protein [unclassified Pseudoalteromonas]